MYYANALICRYRLLARTVCPQLEQPHKSQFACAVGQLTEVYFGLANMTNGTATPLLPYSIYQVFLQADNSIASALSSAASVTTLESGL